MAIAYDLWAVTAKLEVRFRHPVPLGQPLTLVGEMTRLRSRTLGPKAKPTCDQTAPLGIKA
ncbi:MAG: hypothetical protein GTN71_18380 [Anaerolineae bacterium]|nr:hypothetical protein [Anaerolineae bacterium]